MATLPKIFRPVTRNKLIFIFALFYFQRDPDQAHLKEGHIGLSGLQVRGHAMFSHQGLPLDSETLEYGWLVEAIIGDITGKLTSPQVSYLICKACLTLTS